MRPASTWPVSVHPRGDDKIGRLQKKCVCLGNTNKIICNFGNDFSGEMSEWFKEHAWKVCVLQKGTAGSNPALSAD